MEPIPIYLTNRDLLEPVRGMVAHLRTCDHAGPIHIVDCASTYPPLLEWYESAHDLTVIHCDNEGPRAPFDHLDASNACPFYFVSDADLDLSGVPRDFLALLAQGLTDHPDRIKAGLSLEIEDLPADLPLTAGVIDMERHYWERPIEARCEARWFDAPIDTTAALYRRGTGWGGYGPALRAARPYTARHLAWYLKPGNIPPDWTWYLDHLSAKGILWSPRLAAAR